MNTTLTAQIGTVLANSVNSYCTPRAQGEPLPEYASRVLRYALTFGIDPLSMSQLELADSTASLSVASLPSKLSYDQAKLNEWLHTLRLRLQARMQQKRAQLAQLQRMIDQASSDPDQNRNAPSATDTAELTDQERAIRMLRAALILIMDPPSQDGDGGKGARLIPPSPTRPNQGIALASHPAQQQGRRF